MYGGRSYALSTEVRGRRVQDMASTCQVAPSPVKLVVLVFHRDRGTEEGVSTRTAELTNNYQTEEILQKLQ